MDKITQDQVKHIIKLANLQIPEEEIGKFQTQLSAILNYFTILEKVNTEKVEETNHVTGLSDVFNPDGNAPIQTFSQKEALKNSKHSNGKYFEVPAVISKT